MIRYFTAVLIICCILSAEYLLLMQCYKVATLQHLTAAEYFTFLFSAECTPMSMVRHIIAVRVTCYIASVKYNAAHAVLQGW